MKYPNFNEPKLSLGKAFIAASFNDQEEMKAELDAMVTSLEEHGYEAIVFIRENTDGMNVNQMLDAAYAKIDASSLLVVNLTHDPRGVFLEVGYAVKKSIPVLALVREGEKVSSTMAGSVSEPIRTYANVAQIPSILSELLEPYLQKERERRIQITEGVNHRLLNFVLAESKSLVVRYIAESNILDSAQYNNNQEAKDELEDYLSLVFAKEFCIAMRNAQRSLVNLVVDTSEMFLTKGPEFWEKGNAYFGAFEIIEVLLFEEIRSRSIASHDLTDIEVHSIQWIWRSGQDGNRIIDINSEIQKITSMYPKEGQLTRAQKR